MSRNPGRKSAARRPARRRVVKLAPLGRPQGRLRALMVVLLAVSLLFVGRLVQIQAIQSASLAAEAVDSRLTRVPLKATRGSITDVRGVVLAGSVERRTITADPELLAGYQRRDAKGRSVGPVLGPQDAAAELSPLLGMDAGQLTELLSRRSADDKPLRYVVVKKDVEPQVWRTIQERKIPGLRTETTSKRTYPAGQVAGNLIGFVSQGEEQQPSGGIELMQQRQLAGKDGYRVFERGRMGQMIPTGDRDEVPAQTGADVVLTVDRDLQWYAQQRLAEAVEQTGSQWGNVTILDPRTGHVLALAEAPTLDPNNPGATKAADRGSHALSDVIEPGSTAKVITAAAVLEEKLVTPTSQFTVPDTWSAPNGQTFKDAHDHPTKRLTFNGVIAESSNTGTVMAGMRLSKEQRYDYLTRFGFGQASGLGFPGETRGILSPADKWDGRQQYTVLFGQGVSVNAMQSAQVYATIANGGVRMPPTLVAGTTQNGTFTPAPPAEGVRVVSPETADQVRTMLESVVADGTGGKAAIPGYRIAGKTGTSQAPAKGGYDGYTGTFIGFAPAENPQLVVSVTLQRPVNGHFGGDIAAPVFKDVMSYALQARQVPPSGQPANPFPSTW